MKQIVEEKEYLLSITNKRSDLFNDILISKLFEHLKAAYGLGSITKGNNIHVIVTCQGVQSSLNVKTTKDKTNIRGEQRSVLIRQDTGRSLLEPWLRI